MMKQNTSTHRRLGVVGGLGPETGFRFALNVNNKFKSITNCQPDILVDNIPVSDEVESRIISGEKPKEMLDLTY